MKNWKKVDGKPYLQIKTDITKDELSQITGDSSITPKTRDVTKTKGWFLQEDQTQGPEIFETEYSFKGDICIRNEKSKVTRFGINNQISSDNTVEEKEGGAENQSVNSIASSDYSKIKTYIVNPPDLKPIEKEIITKALTHLKSGTNNAVIVDIYARDYMVENSKDRKCIINKVIVKLRETHSVVITKTATPHEFLIIDPSDWKFSCVLSQQTIDMDTLKTPDKFYKAYHATDKQNIGPNNDQWRECIDVAVKMAFLFNEYALNNIEATSTIDFAEKTHPVANVVQKISNIEKTDPNYFLSTADKYRDKQSSNTEKIESTNRNLKNVQAQYKELIKDSSIKNFTQSSLIANMVKSNILKLLEENNNDFTINADKYKQALIRYFNKSGDNIVNDLLASNNDLRQTEAEAELVGLCYAEVCSYHNSTCDIF